MREGLIMLFKTYLIEELIKDISMGPFGSDIKKEVYQSSGIPVLNGSNLFGFKLNEDSFGYVSEEKANQLFKCNAHRGDIVVTHRGTLGQIIYIPNDSKFERYVISQSQFRLTCDDTLVIPEYLVYYFHTKIGQNKLLSNASQVGVPALARATTTFRKIEISIPPIYYQKEVIKVLLSLDAKIETNNKLNEKLEEMAQAIFKSWFVDFEPFKNQPFHETELGMIPDGWEVINIDCVYDIKYGNNLPTSEIKEKGQYPVYGANGVIGYFNTFNCNGYSVLITSRGNGSGDVYRTHSSKSFVTNNSFIVKTRTNYTWIELSYIYYSFLNINFKSYTNGSAQPQLTNKSIHNIDIVLPSKKDIENFCDITMSIINNIESLMKENARLASLRDTLLPRLMSGEIKI